MFATTTTAAVTKNKQSTLIEIAAKIARDGQPVDRSQLQALDKAFSGASEAINDFVKYSQSSRYSNQFTDTNFSYNILLPLMAIFHRLSENGYDAETIQRSYPSLVKAFGQLLDRGPLSFKEQLASATSCTALGLPADTRGSMTELSQHLPIVKAIVDHLQQQQVAATAEQQEATVKAAYQKGVKEIEGCNNVPAMVINQFSRFQNHPNFSEVKEELKTKLMATFLVSLNAGGVNHAKFIAQYKKDGSGFLYTANFEKSYPGQSVSDVVLEKVASAKPMSSTTIKALDSLCPNQAMVQMSICVGACNPDKLKQEIANPFTMPDDLGNRRKTG